MAPTVGILVTLQLTKFYLIAFCVRVLIMKECAAEMFGFLKFIWHIVAKLGNSLAS